MNDDLVKLIALVSVFLGMWALVTNLFCIGKTETKVCTPTWYMKQAALDITFIVLGGRALGWW